MKPYSLLLISERKPDSPDGIHGSNQMIGWGLWSGLSKLSHVSLFYHDATPSSGRYRSIAWRAALAAIPQVDFTLIHSYTPGPIFDEMAAIKAKTGRQVMWISEQPYSRNMDHCFTFLPYSGCTQVSLPALRGPLETSMSGVSKMPGSILLDHVWSRTGAYKLEGQDPNLWCDRLYEWLYPLKDSRVVGQMESPEHERLAGMKIPEWVRRVPNAFYPEYLKTTAPYENFIMTHPGTYEHSIIDMAARGIRVIVPTPTVDHKHTDGWTIVRGGEPFAPWDTINRLNLPMVTTREDLVTLLDKPHEEPRSAALCTYMPGVAAIIDLHCQKVLG